MYDGERLAERKDVKSWYKHRMYDGNKIDRYLLLYCQSTAKGYARTAKCCEYDGKRGDEGKVLLNR